MEIEEFYPKHAEKLAAIAAGLGCTIAPRNGHYSIFADLLRRLAAPAKTAAKELAQQIARDDAQDARTFADLTALLSPAGLKPSEFPTLEEVRSGRYLNLSAIGIHSATAHDLTRPFHGEPTGLKITINTAGALIQIVKILTAERGISRAS